MILPAPMDIVHLFSVSLPDDDSMTVRPKMRRISGSIRGPAGLSIRSRLSRGPTASPRIRTPALSISPMKILVASW